MFLQAVRQFALLVVVASGLLAPASTSISRWSPVYVASEGCRGHQIRPRSITLACADGNLYATGIRYQSYGGRIARALATLHVNDCHPDCADGRFRTYGGTLRLERIVRCGDGRLYYSHAVYPLAEGGRRRPVGYATAYIQPFDGCSARSGPGSAAVRGSSHQRAPGLN